jgi:flavin reductase (DIM6/NTAB) family NADH-FMN oxidoreductase RutF
MSKIEWKPGNMVYPIPAVMVSVRDKEGKDNILTVAWVGTVCTNPPMVSISVRPERYSYKALEETGEFVINLTTEDLAYATDFCGVRSGKDYDKFKECHLTKEEGSHVAVSMIKESPVNIECKVREAHKYGSHTMFTADVLAVHVDDAYMNENGKFCLENANPIVYSHGTYFTMGEELGTFGYSVKKAKKVTKEKTATAKTSDRIGKERTKPRWKKSRKKK